MWYKWSYANHMWHKFLKKSKVKNNIINSLIR